MSEAIIVGVISVAGSIVVQLIVSYSKYRETSASIAAHEQKQQDALNEVNKELIEVKKRLDSHNGYAEKFAAAQRDIAITQRDIEYIKDRVKSIEYCKIK